MRFRVKNVFAAVGKDLILLAAETEKNSKPNCHELKFDINTFINRYWRSQTLNTSNKQHFIEQTDTYGRNTYIFCHNFGNLVIGLITSSASKYDILNTKNSISISQDDASIESKLIYQTFSEKEQYLHSIYKSNNSKQHLNNSMIIIEQFYHIVNFIYYQICIIFKNGLLSCVDDNIDFLDAKYKDANNNDFRDKIKLLKCNCNVLRDKIDAVFDVNWCRNNFDNVIQRQNIHGMGRCIQNENSSFVAAMGALKDRALNNSNNNRLHCILIGCDDGGNALSQFRSYLMTGIPDSQVSVVFLNVVLLCLSKTKKEKYIKFILFVLSFVCI